MYYIENNIDIAKLFNDDDQGMTSTKIIYLQGKKSQIMCGLPFSEGAMKK